MVRNWTKKKKKTSTLARKKYTFSIIVKFL